MTTPPGDERDDARRRPSTIDPTVLARQARLAQAVVPLQSAPELYEAMTSAEIEAEQQLARWERAQRRRQRKRAVRGELTEARRGQRAAASLRRRDARQSRWLANARADRARATNPDALVGALHHRAKRSSLLLRCVMGVGLLWSAVNVGRNLTPAGIDQGPTWWMLWALSFGIEAMISVPILEIMAQAATAARLGQRVDRRKILFFEAALLTGTVALNCGPHLVGGDYGRAAEYSVAPVMVVVLMWLHAWLTSRYAELIDQVGGDRADLTDIETTSAETPLLEERSWRAAVAAGGGGVEDPPSGAVERGAAGEGSEEFDDVIPDEMLRRIVRQMLAAGRSEKTEGEIVEILTFASTGMNVNAITTAMTAGTGVTWSRSTVDRIVGRAVEFGFPKTPTRLEVVTDQTTA
ncbi:hypothetical protein ACWEKT_20380 [Nocardia takedensis]|uniref:hypothetical protein n=1 Tax=Nocardia takedensis TaxID=259390 RepID=UPI0002E6A25C|nr:hypothetical protein [Nocardia takedensis]